MKMLLDDYRNELHSKYPNIRTSFDNRKLIFTVDGDGEKGVYPVEYTMGTYTVNI